MFHSYYISPILTKSIQQYTQIGEKIEKIKQIFSTPQKAKNQKYAEILKGLNTQLQIAMMQQAGFNTNQIAGALATEKLTGEEIKQALVTAGLLPPQEAATASTSKLSLAYRGLATSLGLSTAALTGWIVGIGAIAAAVTIFAVAWDQTHISLKEAEKALKETKEEYSDITSELKKCNTELETTEARMKELEAIELSNLSFAEKEELGNLRKYNNELERTKNLYTFLEQEKAKELGNKFVQTMKSDVDDSNEYWKDEDNNQVYKGNVAWAQLGGTLATRATEKDYLKQQFAEREKLLEQLHASTDSEERKRIQKSINDIDDYFETKIKNWTSNSDGVNYISSPSNEDEKAVNEWLDYINDFQDKVTLALTTDPANNAKVQQDVFNRIVDNWKFDKPLQGLQDLGEQGEVTAKMLMNPNYDEFLRKLYEIGFIDSTRSVEELEKIADAFNKIAEAKENSGSTDDTSVFSIEETEADALTNYQSKLNTLSSSISNLYNLNSTDITSLMTDFREYAHIFEEFGVTGEAGVGDVEGALRKIADTIRTKIIKEVPQMADAINAIFDSLINHPKGDINKVRAELEELEKVYDDIADSKTMDMDAATALINKYPELAGAVEVVGDAYTFERDAIVDLINARIENFNSIASDEYDAIQEALKNIQARIDGYMAEYNAMRTLSLARGNAFTNGLHTDKMYAKDQEHLSDPAYQKMLEEEQRLKELLDDLEEGTKKNFDLESIIGKSSKDTSQTFDWYETYLDRIGTKISELGNRANDSYSTWSKRNAELVNQLELLEGKKSVLEDIIKPAYEDKMGDIELEMKSSGMNVEDVKKYTTLIKEGLWDSSDHTLGIETITDETQIELIEKYLEIYEKWLSVSQEANATNRELKDGERQKFENISKQFDNELSILESREASLNNMIALTEAKGYALSSVVYSELGKVLEGQYLGKMAEQEDLIKQLDDSMASGKITMFSDEWYEAKDAINQTTLECQDLNLAVIDCDKQVRQLEWDNFDRMMEAIHDVVEETEFLASLFSNADMVDEAGKITKEGLAVLGQYGVGYQTYMAKSKDYANELLDIREQLADDPYNLELQEREEELLGLQRESIQNAMDEKQAMIEIAQEAIQAQIDKTQELVDKKKEALDAEQELREYQNSLTEKTDDLGNLRKQESVYALDNSEEGQQKLQTIRTQIKDAEKDLDEFTYSKWHQDQNTMLDELMAEYTELQEARSADTETLFNEMVTAVNTNAGVISELLNTKAQELGITLSGTAEAIWNKYVADTKYSNILTEYGGATSTDVTGVKDAIAGESGTNQRLQDINSSISGAEGTNQKLTTINDSLTSEAGLSGQVGKVTSALTGDNSITSALTGQNGVTNAIDDIKAQFEGNDGVIAKFGDITGALVGDDGTTVTGSVGKLWEDYKKEHEVDNTNLKNYNDKVYARWEAEDKAQTESDQKTSERWSATDEALKALSGDAFNILTGIQFMRDQLYGEGENGLTGIQSVLSQIFEWLEEGNLAININSAGNIGKGDNSDSTPASTVASAGISAAAQVASIINKAKDISKTKSGSLIGQVIKSASGKWYTSSDGEEAGTAVNKYSPDYWKVDKYQKGAAYPYHIQAFIDDEPAGGSGWVKASQIGYKHGSKHIDKDQYAWTQEGYGENELVYRASDGAIYTRLGEGDMIFTHEQTQKLWELTRGNLGVDYPMKQYRMPEMPAVVNGGNVYLDIGDVVLPNVHKPEDFAVQLVDTLKHSSKAQKAIRAVSVDLLAGKSIMGVNRI